MLRSLLARGAELEMPLLQQLSAALGAAAPARAPVAAALAPVAWRAGSATQPPVRQATSRSFACTAALGRPAANAAASAQEQDQYADEGDRIGEVDWNQQLVNAVSLVGRLAAPIELRPANNSQVAKCCIAVRSSSDKTREPFWFDLEIWGDLAASAAASLRKGEQIQVLGRLRQRQWTDRTTGAKRMAVFVNVNSVNRVAQWAGGAAADEWGGGHGGQEPLDAPGYHDQAAGAAGWGNEPQQQRQQQGQGQEPGTWEHLISSFTEYWDNRTGKRSDRAPDFKHKDTGKALWLNSAPAELHEQLSKLPPPAARF